MNDFKEMHRQLVHVEERRDTEHDYACLASEASDVAVHPHVGVLSDGHRPLVVRRVRLQHSNAAILNNIIYICMKYIVHGSKNQI